MHKLIVLFVMNHAFCFTQQIVEGKNGKFGIDKVEYGDGYSYNDPGIPYIYEDIKEVGSFFFACKKADKNNPSFIFYNVDIFDYDLKEVGSYDEINFDMKYNNNSNSCADLIVAKIGASYCFLSVNSDKINVVGDYDQINKSEYQTIDESGCVKTYFEVKKNQEISVVEPNGKIVIGPIIADNMSYLTKGNLFQFNHNKLGTIYNNQGIVIVDSIVNTEMSGKYDVPCTIFTNSNLKKSIQIYNQFYDLNADEIIACLYFSDRIIIANDGFFTIHNSKLESACPEKFEDILPFDSHDCAAAKKNGKYIFIDANGQRIGNLEVDFVSQLGSSFYIYKTEGLEGLFVTSSPQFIPANTKPLEKVLLNDYETVLYAQQDSKWGYISEDQPTFNFEFSFISTRAEYYESDDLLFAAYTSGQHVVIDEYGKVFFKELQLINITGLEDYYDDPLLILHRTDGVELVSIYRYRQEQKLDFKYDEIIFDLDLYDYFYYGMKVKKEGRTGIASFHNDSIYEIIPTIYDEIDFSDYELFDMGVIITRNGDKYGIYYIYDDYDTTFEATIEPRYDKIYRSDDYSSLVLITGKFYGIYSLEHPPSSFINPVFIKEPSEDFFYGDPVIVETQVNGKQEWLYKFDGVFLSFDSFIQYDKKLDVYIFRQENKFGVIDLENGGFIAPTYDEIIPINDEQFIVRIGSKWGMLDIYGGELIPLEFNSMEEVLEYLRQ